MNSTNDATMLGRYGILGIVSLLSYCTAMLLSPLAYPGYSWMSQAVSDLSAVSAPSRELWARLSCLHEPCAIACVTAASAYVTDRRTGDHALRAGVCLFAAMNWLSAVGYRLFPLTEADTIATASDIGHLVVTAGVVLTSIASLSLIALSGMRGKGPRSLGLWAAACLAAMFAGSVGTGALPKSLFGIAERVSLLAAVGFNASLGIHLYRGDLG